MRETCISLREDTDIGERCYTIRHRSGLKILLVSKKLTTAYALFATRFGARDMAFRRAGEKDFCRVPDGIAHFLEHKMFDMADGTDAFEQFAAVGAYANAYTSEDVTAYEISCAEKFEEALAILLDCVTHPHFTVETVAKEQGIIAEEIRMGQDNPSRRLYDELRKLLFHCPQNRLEICGTEESIAGITPEMMYACHRAFYNLRNMTLCVCGDVTPEAVVAVADRELPAADAFETERYTEAEPAHIAGKRAEVTADIGKTMFAIGIKDTARSENGMAGVRRRLILQLLAELLFGVSGTFYNTLYDEGLLNGSYGGGYESTRGAGFYGLYGESDAPDEVYARLIARCEEARRTPPPQADFERIRRMMYADFVRTFNATESVAGDLLDYDLCDADLFEVGRALASLTYEELFPALDSFFREENAVLAIISPKTT